MLRSSPLQKDPAAFLCSARSPTLRRTPARSQGQRPRATWASPSALPRNDADSNLFDLLWIKFSEEKKLLPIGVIERTPPRDDFSNLSSPRHGWRMPRTLRGSPCASPPPYHACLPPRPGPSRPVAALPTPSVLSNVINIPAPFCNPQSRKRRTSPHKSPQLASLKKSHFTHQSRQTTTIKIYN